MSDSDPLSDTPGIRPGQRYRDTKKGRVFRVNGANGSRVSVVNIEGKPGTPPFSTLERRLFNVPGRFELLPEST